MIYISHSSSFDYQSELYQPLKKSSLSRDNEFFLPHEGENRTVATKAIIEQADLLVAEVSFPSTGQGIELAWATAAGTPVLCLYRAGTQPSRSLGFLGLTPVVYADFAEFLKQVESKVLQVSGSKVDHVNRS